MTRRPAWEVPGGRLVAAEIAGRAVLCLKAQRQARDYVNHYLVALDPLPDGGRAAMALHYVDPDTPVEERANALDLDAAAGAEAAVGDVLATASGRFLKVFDTARAERHFAYVDLASGEIRPRRERRGGSAMVWRVVAANSTADVAD